MFVKTVIVRLPSPDTPRIAIPSSYLYRLRQKFQNEGKLLAMSTIMHPDQVTQVSVRLFRDEKAHEEWLADPIVQAQLVLYEDHYARNKMVVETTYTTL
jgi:hypothetical protein